VFFPVFSGFALSVSSGLEANHGVHGEGEQEQEQDQEQDQGGRAHPWEKGYKVTFDVFRGFPEEKGQK